MANINELHYQSIWILTSLEHHYGHALRKFVVAIRFDTPQKLFNDWMARIDFQRFLLSQVVADEENNNK